MYDLDGLLVVAALEIAAAIAIIRKLWITAPPRGARQETFAAVPQFLKWFAAFLAVAAFAAGFLEYQDTPWQQITVSEFGIQPPHLFAFLVVYPAYVLFGGAAYMVAQTRLPEMFPALRKHLLVALVIPFAFLPSFGPAVLDLTAEPSQFGWRAASWLLSLAWVVLGVAPLLVIPISELLKVRSR